MELGKGSEGVKFGDNLRAIEILKNLEEQDRRATPNEQRALAHHVGWGGFANAFRSPESKEFKPEWSECSERLEGLFTPEELRRVRESTQFAHYTSKPIIDGMWQIAKRLGFIGGLSLESPVGTGNSPGSCRRTSPGKRASSVLRRTASPRASPN